MKSSSAGPRNQTNGPLIPGVMILAVVLLVTLWAVRYFSAESRVHRATARVVRTVQKTEAESPVSLGLAANRLGKVLATNVVLSLDEVGVLTTSRQETVQLFARIRQSLERMTFEDPVITVDTVEAGAVEARVVAQYDFDAGGGEAVTGKGMAVLLWRKGRDGWRLVQAVLHAEDGAPLPKGWL